MQNRVQANEYRNTLVCIDSYEDGVLDGRLYHPQLHSGEQFHSAIHFLRKMERLLDATKFPQAFSTPRAFGASAAERARSSRNRTQDGQNRHLHRQGHLRPERQAAGLCGLAGGRQRTAIPQRVRAAPPDGQRYDQRQPDGKEQLTPAKFPGDPGPKGPLKDTDHGKPPERAGRKAMGAKALRHASPAASIPFLLQKMRRRTK